jgi:hypothetical protein
VPRRGSTGRRAADREVVRVDAQPVCVLADPVQRGVRVVQPGRELVFRCESVADGDDDDVTLDAALAADRVANAVVDRTLPPAAAVQCDVRGKHGLVAGAVDPASDLAAVDCHDVVGDRLNLWAGAAVAKEVEVDEQPHVATLLCDIEVVEELAGVGVDELLDGWVESHQAGVLAGCGVRTRAGGSGAGSAVSSP